MTTILITVATLSFLGIALAVVLFAVAQKFKVEEDPRIDDVEASLPGANCGGCGCSGCRAFAEACVKADTLDNLYCPVGGAATMSQIAGYLGKVAAAKAPLEAVVRCAGSCDKRPRTSHYNGAASCRVKAALYKGDTDCAFGCLGDGDCEKACAFDALFMNPITGLPEVIEDKCIACNACVKACPKNIIELRKKGPKNRRLYVSCMNKDKGGIARKACTAACIGCAKCQKACAFDAITITQNLAYIDSLKCKLCRKCTDECPTHAIQEMHFPEKVKKETSAPVTETIA